MILDIKKLSRVRSTIAIVLLIYISYSSLHVLPLLPQFFSTQTSDILIPIVKPHVRFCDDCTPSLYKFYFEKFVWGGSREGFGHHTATLPIAWSNQNIKVVLFGPISEAQVIFVDQKGKVLREVNVFDKNLLGIKSSSWTWSGDVFTPNVPFNVFVVGKEFNGDRFSLPWPPEDVDRETILFDYIPSNGTFTPIAVVFPIIIAKALIFFLLLILVLDPALRFPLRRKKV